MRFTNKPAALSLLLVGLAACGVQITAARPAAAAPDPQLVLAQDGQSLAPIVIFADAPPLTRLAADELAYYIEKTSGAKPEVIEGRPDPLPERAIWVGYQPVLDGLFPDLDFNFQHPEEILIAANENHMVIAGRDRWDPDNLTVAYGRTTVQGVQQEYGTHNAVYTFLQDYLGVRWLWPGELGEDVLHQPTIAFAPFEYRYHSQVRARAGLLAYSTLHRVGPGGLPSRRGFSSGYWLRAQRLQLCELPSPGGGGGWGRWWHRFHETHPEFFALQPDGTRGGGAQPYPSVHTIKMCHSNPDLWRQWVDDVAEELKQNPNLRVFNAAPGDGYNSGHCVCDNCRAWDHPDGEPRRLLWQGVTQNYLALSDRDITFANHVARLLKERFPDKDLYVYTYAYGHACPPPVAAVPDDNVIVGNVANFLLRSDMVSRDSLIGGKPRDYFAGWGKFTKNHFWRPNVGSPVGFQWGMPDVPLRRTMEDMRFAAEHGMMGFYVDYVREHWSTQGPLYYLMAQLVWNPHADGEAILNDYHQRAFGPAAAQMAAYWDYMEQIREECYGTENPGQADHDIVDFYNQERLDKAYDLLNAAKAALGPADERYRRRIDFVAAGLDLTRLVTECGRLVRPVRRFEDPDGAARARIQTNWEEIRALQKNHPDAVRWRLFWTGTGKEARPQSPRGAPELWVEAAPPADEVITTQEWLAERNMVVSDEWEMVFSDHFDRDELGDDWEAVDGSTWEISDGWLRGTGIVMSRQGFPGGFLRLEYEAMTDVEPAQFEGQVMETPVCDLSALIHILPSAEGNPLRTGYFFQFGGFNNTRSSIRLVRQRLAERQDEAARIIPEKLHRIVVENDAGILRLTVNGEVVLEHQERGSPQLQEGQDRVGFFLLTPGKIRKVNVYVKRISPDPADEIQETLLSSDM